MKCPGEELQKELSKSGMSRKELAIRTGVTEKHISTVINGERSVSVAFSRKLGYVFHNASYWIDLQAKYDNEQQRIQEINAISKEEISILKPLRDIIAYLIEMGYMHNSCGDVSKVIQLREFLRISDLTLIPKITYNAAYRAQITSNVRVDPYILFAWQRLCEKETENIIINQPLNKKNLKNNIGRIKEIMFSSISDGIYELQDVFADCGIAFQVVKNFRGAPVQGFIKETENQRLILCLTIRGRRADRFWFTLFHEIAHILNEDYKSRFIDFDSIQGKNEEEADKFARDTLIPDKLYGDFILSSDCTSWSGITSFAEKVNVQPFIVLGRLQNDGYLDWSDFADKVVSYRWVN